MNFDLKPYLKVKVYEDPKSEQGFEGNGILVHPCFVSPERAEKFPGLERWGVALPKEMAIVNRWISPRHLVS